MVWNLVTAQAGLDYPTAYNITFIVIYVTNTTQIFLQVAFLT